MNNGRQSIHRFTIHKDIQLNQLCRLIIRQLIIERSIASGGGFQLIKIIIDYFTERNMINYHNPVHIQIVHALELTALILGNLHNSAHEILWHDYRGLNEWLLNMINGSRVRQVGRIIHRYHFPVSLKYVINNTWSGCYKLQIILTLQTLLNNVHVKQAQEATTIAKAKGNGGLWLKNQGSIVKLELFQGIL